MASRDFAKIVRASSGLQVLFYVEPDGGDYKVHQVVTLRDAQADLAVVFAGDDEDANERKAYAMFDALGVEHADKLIAHVVEMTGLEAA